MKFWYERVGRIAMATMKIRTEFLVLALVLFACVSVFGVGTLTQTVATSKQRYRKISLNWTSTAGGAVSGILTTNINGKIVGATFDPGTPAPTALYDVVLLDSDGFDVLAGQGANLSATVTTKVVPGVPFKDGTTTSVAPAVINSTLELQVSNAGASTQGKVILLIE